MRQVSINQVQDLENLRKILKGDKEIVVRVKKFPYEGVMEALDLRDFRGRLKVYFSASEEKHHIVVRTCNASSCVAFFEHAKAKDIVIEYGENWQFQYDSVIKKVYISTEEQLLMAIQHANCNDRVKLLLERDIVITHVRNIKVPSYLDIMYQRHKIYVPQGTKENFWRTQVEYYQTLISVKDVSDFDKLQKIVDDVVVVRIKKDLQNFVLKSLSLKNFSGHLIILGNHHVFYNGLIEGPGMISELANSASLTIRDLTMEQVVVNAKQCDYVGAFLGTHQTSCYAGFPGKVLFYNCHLFNSYVKEGQKNTGAFVGHYDENMYAKKSTASHVYSEESTLNRIFGPDVSVEFFSYDPNESKPYSLARERRKR